MKWWYPTVVRDKRNAVKFKFTDKSGAGSGVVTAGSNVVIMATGRASDGKSMEKYSLALPETAGAQKIYLYTGGTHSLWIPWIVNDRNYDVELFYGDELLIFSERYLPERLKNPIEGANLVDPYKRLMVDAYSPQAPAAIRYLSWRAGEWDLWVLEKDT
jgi:hypothetical protein